LLKSSQENVKIQGDKASPAHHPLSDAHSHSQTSICHKSE